MNKLSQPKRNETIDFLKGIAIVAVMLYHFSNDFFAFGYLGVEIFLVVSGFLTIRSVINSIENGSFSFLKQITNRIIRLLPSLILIIFVALLLGYFLMLPDDYENLVQSAISSSFFANNILAAITTKNYWDVVNVYKPLMHTWYIGLLMQADIFILGSVCILNKIFKNKTYIALKWFLCITTVFSFVLFLSPCFKQEEIFYFLPFRLFEITLGGLVAFITHNKKFHIQPNKIKIISALCFFSILVLLFVKIEFLSSIKLILVVLLTSICVLCNANNTIHFNIFTKPLQLLGKNSFPLYISHQCIIAFFYYSFFPKATFSSLIVFIIAVSIISLLLHFAVEKPIAKLIKGKKQKLVIISCAALTTLVCVFSFFVYQNSGVVRDVPELNISFNNTSRNMHSSYCDKPYSWDKDFSSNNDIKILVIGNSYGRDWANILNESTLSQDIEISYVYIEDKNYEDTVLKRLSRADYVFCALPGEKDIYDFCKNNIPKEKLWVVGHKSFGESNGYIYKFRFDKNYFSRTQAIDASLLIFNDKMKQQYKNHFIDMLEPVLCENNQVKVFTKDGKFISQDCRHLTESGAKFYAENIDFSFIRSKKEP